VRERGPYCRLKANDGEGGRGDVQTQAASVRSQLLVNLLELLVDRRGLRRGKGDHEGHR
jgi:hypothetical protein